MSLGRFKEYDVATNKQRATRIPSSVFDDLTSMTQVELLEVSAGNDYRQGGKFIDSGSFDEMRSVLELPDNMFKSLHIKLSNGFYYPDDYITHYLD